MTDRRASLTVEIARLDRRQVIGVVAGGALLGSAWAAVFRDAVLAGDDAHLTIARTGTALGVMIDYRGHRVMLIDAGDGPGAEMVTEVAAGFLRQRIDAVLLPATAANVLPNDYRDRWRVRDVWTLPDLRGSTPASLAGRSLGIGRLRIETDALPVEAWREGATPESQWYVSVTLGRSRLNIASDGEAVTRVPVDASMANAIVCGDVNLEPPRVPAGIDVIAVPFEAAERVPEGPRVVALSSEAAVTFRLREDGIEPPGVF